MELRRGKRIGGEFWVSVEGVDDTPLLRRGDISLTGAYFAIESEVGAAGSVQFLHLASADWEQSVQVLARLVRVAKIDDARKGMSSGGIAVEFLPETTETRERLEALVRHVAKLQAEARGETFTCFDDPMVADGVSDSESATVQKLNVGGIIIETNWDVQVGEELRVSIQRMGIELDSEVLGMNTVVTNLESVPGSKDRYEIRLGISAGSVRSDITSLGSDAACESMLEDLVNATQTASDLSPDRLVGNLSRICLSSIVTLLSMEGAEGELQVTRDNLVVGRIHVKDGLLIDAECTPIQDSPRQALFKVLSWREGTFEFVAKEVNCEDVIQSSTTAILLEAAVDEDHAVKA